MYSPDRPRPQTRHASRGTAPPLGSSSSLQPVPKIHRIVFESPGGKTEMGDVL
ncbi:hypothetical protein PGTUg99_030589 [Puccinia graminis f. sp. tritici]|uniref:Uncharacterized protein n=1 Tax=Puccinia graminis f. sp. tritici TaxID=56615 RepID=A0A5B0MYM8_PUCGR|nr:hypothetical protein PGTUg99_030589 [Puccinia graminis f. sp. tritici]